MRALEVHQIIAQTGKGARMGLVAAAIQVLADQIKHGGEGAEVIVLLDMELQACFVHGGSMAQVGSKISKIKFKRR